MAKRSDVTWYWVGGTVAGEWRAADPGTREALRRAGYVAHDGLHAVGAPEGAPSEADFASVLGR